VSETSRGWLTRRLWPEPPAEREYRIGRFLINVPLGLVLGTSFGFLAAERWGLAALPAGVWGGTAGLLAMYLLGQVESFASAVTDARGPRSGFLVRIGVNILGGAFFGRLFSVVLDAHALTSLAAGASLLVAYSALTTRFFLGGWAEGLVETLTGQHGGPRPLDYSYAESLLARGWVDEALAEYEEHADRRPGDPDPLLRAAWALREHGEWRRAVAWFRRALAATRIDARRASIVAREILAIHRTKLDDSEGAAADLEGVVRRFPGAEELAWARRELDDRGTSS
jgi:hypothetical protein